MLEMSKIVIESKGLDQSNISFMLVSWFNAMVKELNKGAFKKYDETDILIRKMNIGPDPAYKAYLKVSAGRGRHIIVQDLEDGKWMVVDRSLFKDISDVSNSVFGQ